MLVAQLKNVQRSTKSNFMKLYQMLEYRNQCFIQQYFMFLWIIVHHFTFNKECKKMPLFHGSYDDKNSSIKHDIMIISRKIASEINFSHSFIQ